MHEKIAQGAAAGFDQLPPLKGDPAKLAEAMVPATILLCASDRFSEHSKQQLMDQMRLEGAARCEQHVQLITDAIHSLTAAGQYLHSMQCRMMVAAASLAQEEQDVHSTTH